MKSLVSKSFSGKKGAAIVASFIVLFTSTGFITYETTKKTVNVSLNGQKKSVHTHAETVEELFEELDIRLSSKDSLSPSKQSRIQNNSTIKWKQAKQVQLSDENRKIKLWTTSLTVKELLKEQKITLKDYDKVTPKLNTYLKKDMSINIFRAFPLTLNNGGEEKRVWSTSTTVADFLTQQGIKLSKLDRVEPTMDEKIMKNGIINVIRVEKVTDVVEEPVSFAVVSKKDSSLPVGTEKVITPGKEGLMTKKYEITLENGKEISRKVLSKKVLKDKQDKVVAIGTNDNQQQISRGTTNGKEIYVSATAYTASCSGCSGVTATGINLQANPNVKIIAVDPNVIPLGSKVYVDGYGYAVAADTGSAIKGNKIDVFVPSATSASQWGRKTVRIKILN